MKINFFSKFILYIKKGCSFFYGFIKPKSTNEDLKRREFILNIILSGSLFLSFLVIIMVISDFLKFGKQYTGAPPILQFFIFTIFLGLYLLSRKGFFIIASYILIGLYFISVTYTIYYWGADTPQGLLTYALLIVISGILIGTKFAFITTMVVSLTLITVSYVQINIVGPKLYWENRIFGLDDVLVFIFTFSIIMIVSWLSNREFELSLYRARGAEADLQKERDSLEIKVAERTREIKELQAEKMLQMHRFAEFGKMAGGLFHDLVNPLTAALLSVDEFKRKYGAELKEKSLDLEKIFRNINRMKIFTEAARKQMQNRDSRGDFSPTEEIIMALDTLSYKARRVYVNLIYSPPKNISKIYGNQIKFYRLMCDLISNAIDSYKEIPKSESKRQVEIGMAQENGNIIISVKDYGCGIKKDNMDKIFQPLFTTKEVSEGTGLGLFISKNTIENDFGGKIELESEEGKGTVFVTIIPANINHKA